MLNVGELIASIRLDGIDQYDNSLDKAGKKLSAHNQELNKTKQFMRDSFVTGAQMIGTATTALAAFTVGLFKSGAAYNTLQQTSRAALKTLLGSTEAVNAQMDKLDAFATTSPFSKAVFITAQQQLIGFGMSAEKVVPTLDAIQNAVAGIGGSNQDVADLSFILAQISAAGKITGQDLLQFGQRGVNAAELIGKAMGKTGAQIKEDISKGRLDAELAIDHLVAQMGIAFDGASANVKTTIEGTKDRVKAASRDIGAILAEPFIDPRGGGYFVLWGNQVADVMRGIQGHVRPLVSLMTERALPAFAGFTELLDKTNVRVRSWDSSKIETFLDTAGRHAPAIAGVSGAIAALTGSMLSGIPVIGPFVDKFKPFPVALASIALASPQVRQALGDLFSSMKPLLGVVGDLAGLLSSGLNAVLPIVASSIEMVTNVATPLVSIIAGIPTPILAAVAAFFAVQKASGTLAPLLGKVVDGFKQFTESAALQAHLGGVSQGMGALSVASMSAQGAVTKVGLAMKAAFISNPIGIAITVIATAASALAWAFGAASEAAKKQQERVANLKTTLDDSGRSTQDTTKAIVEQLRAVEDADYTFESYGVSLEGIIQYSTNTKEAMLALAESLQKQVEAGTELRTTERGTHEALSTSAAKARDLREEVLKQIDALSEAEQTKQDEIRALAEYRENLSDAARDNTKFNEALAIMRDEGSSAAEKVNALNQALNILNGGVISTLEQEQQLNDRTRSLGDAFQQTDEKNRKLAKGLVELNGKINTTTAEGSRLQSQVLGLAGDMQMAVTSADALSRKTTGAGISAEEAAKIMAPYAETLRKQAKEANLSEQATEGLIETYLRVPDTIYTLVTDEGTVQSVEDQMLHLASTILATPDKTIIVDEPYSAEIMEELKDLGYEVKHLPDGKIKITQVGLKTVEEQMEQFQRRQWKVTVQIDGAPSSKIISGGAIARADGGISDFGTHRGPRAANGMIRQPMIAKGGSNILWAEDETIQEAYISRKPGMEERNKKILAEAAGWFGMTTTDKNQPAQTVTTSRDTHLNVNYTNNSGQNIPDEKHLFMIANQLKNSLARGTS